MYALIKKILKKIVPEQSLFKHEELIRAPYGLLYRGNKHQCTICNHTLRRFILTPTGDQLCPNCGSLARTRRLYQLLQNEYELTGNILHFSPPRNLYRRLKKRSDIQYFSTDFEDEFMADYRYDITKIDQKDHFFDTIICYHVLEHIEDDQKAMQELYRVLKPGGTILIQTPFKDGEIYENPTIKTPEERLAHFGQEDHVRIYSVNGLADRLMACKFKVNIQTFDTTQKSKFYGLQEDETMLVVHK